MRILLLACFVGILVACGTGGVAKPAAKTTDIGNYSEDCAPECGICMLSLLPEEMDLSPMDAVVQVELSVANESSLPLEIVSCSWQHSPAALVLYLPAMVSPVSIAEDQTISIYSSIAPTAVMSGWVRLSTTMPIDATLRLTFRCGTVRGTKDLRVHVGQ